MTSRTNHTTVIAEAGVNHNGSLDLAFELVDAAVKAGADYVKFQTFTAEGSISAAAPKAAYQKQTTAKDESQLEMVRKLELSRADQMKVVKRCQDVGIGFMSSPFDMPSLDFLARDVGVDTIKIASGEITNALMLVSAARTQQKIILSTGMATLGDIEIALGAIAYGYREPNRAPCLSDYEAYYNDRGSFELLRDRVTLLHCTTEYPAPIDEVNLRVLDTLREAFGLPVGYSDHTKGITVSIAAVARGATVIEKHLTIDRNLPGPDHTASLEPQELRDMVVAIREVERALGSAQKRCQPSETGNKAIARKSIVAMRPIAQGETLTPENITVKRPGTGISAIRYWETLGSVAQKAYQKDEQI